MVTDRYQRLRHHDTTADLLAFAADAGLTVVAVDNVPGAARLEETALPRDCLLVFGQEGPGITDDASAGAAMTVSIAQFGSTRSINAARRRRHRHAHLDQRNTGDISAGLVGQDLRHGSGMGQSCGQRGSRCRQAASEKALGAARHAARRGRMAAGAARPDVRHLALLVAGASAGLPGRRAGARPAAGARSRRSPGRSGHIGCATTDPGSTTTTTTWRGWRWRWSGRAGSQASRGPAALKKLSDQFVNAWVPEDGGGIPWRKQDQFFNAPANGPPASSWPAMTTGCGAPSRWRTGSTKR